MALSRKLKEYEANRLNSENNQEESNSTTQKQPLDPNGEVYENIDVMYSNAVKEYNDKNFPDKKDKEYDLSEMGNSHIPIEERASRKSMEDRIGGGDNLDRNLEKPSKSLSPNDIHKDFLEESGKPLMYGIGVFILIYLIFKRLK